MKNMVKKFLDVTCVPVVRYLYNRGVAPSKSAAQEEELRRALESAQESERERERERERKTREWEVKQYNDLPVEFSDAEKLYLRKLIEHVQPWESYENTKRLTMVPPGGIFNTLLAVKHALACDIEGDFVECGVWRGGVALLMAGLLRFYGSDRKVYLYDTFSGMTEPCAKDGFVGNEDRINALAVSGASIDQVKNNFASVGLLDEHVVFVEGDVRVTLLDKSNLPQQISVLRLDTDMYESTKAELCALYPLLSKGGVLIVDDYGTWIGSRTAVDEYFDKKRPFFSYIDFGARLAVKE